MFRVAATFPLRPLRQEVYNVPGDEVLGLDPNAVEKLIEETGISHAWEPGPNIVSEAVSPTDALDWVAAVKLYRTLRLGRKP